MKKNDITECEKNKNKKMKMEKMLYERELAKELRIKPRKIGKILNLLKNFEDEKLSLIIKTLIGVKLEKKEKLSNCVSYIRSLDNKIEHSLSLQLYGLVPDYFYMRKTLEKFSPIDSSFFDGTEDSDAYQLYRHWYGVDICPDKEAAFHFFSKCKTDGPLFSRTVKLFFDLYEDDSEVTKEAFVKNTPPSYENDKMMDIESIRLKKKIFEQNIYEFEKMLANNTITQKEKIEIKTKLAVLYTLRAKIYSRLDGDGIFSSLELAIEYGSTYALLFYGVMKEYGDPKTAMQCLIKALECGVHSSASSILLYRKYIKDSKMNEIMHKIVNSKNSSQKEIGRAFFFLGDMERSIKYDNVDALRKILSNPELRPTSLSSDHMIIFYLYALTNEVNYYEEAKESMKRKCIKWIPRFHEKFLSLYLEGESLIPVFNQCIISSILSLKHFRDNTLYQRIPKPVIITIISFLF